MAVKDSAGTTACTDASTMETFKFFSEELVSINKFNNALIALALINIVASLYDWYLLYLVLPSVPPLSFHPSSSSSSSSYSASSATKRAEIRGGNSNPSACTCWETTPV